MIRNKKLILSLMSFIAFLFILIIVVNGTPSIDYSVSSGINKLRNPIMDGFFIFLGNFSREIMIGFALIAALILYNGKRKKESWILLFSLILGYVFEQAIKFSVQRVRPLMQLIQEIDYSFPSGHAIFSIILFSMLIYFFKDEIKNKTTRLIFILINIFLILLIGFSRIYLNVHSFTDVIGGYALGFAVANFVLYLAELRN
ncbi:MAG: phosphatase PAP2 family protein [Nanoarchaeota archaeon]|nr:phosphatase PAP2 family protein [Nanoarchaeota archaeon]